ncbi:MAG: outer membrane protein assembly factor BamE [Proteobacteria bacterium]|nr:outer membrane protein assembly factor BamE [Pseudomonadota bacterium]
MRARLGLAVGIVAVALGGCELGFTDTRGYVPDEDALARLEPGRQSRDDVQQLLGSPASQGVFDAEQSWYYIMRKTYQFAFLQPELLDQRVVVVHFDDSGTLRDVRRYSLEDGMIVDPVTRETPSPGKELGFLEQLFGNLGKFNKLPGAKTN